MSIKNLIAVSALFSFALIAAACGGGATNTTVNVNATKPATTTPAATGTPVAAATTAPKADDKKEEVAVAGDSVGVPECDEYIKKYEACLTKIAAKAPQVETALKSSFEAQRAGFKSGASTPAGKAALSGVCKSAIETAKTATTAYACEW